MVNYTNYESRLISELKPIFRRLVDSSPSLLTTSELSSVLGLAPEDQLNFVVEESENILDNLAGCSNWSDKEVKALNADALEVCLTRSVPLVGALCDLFYWQTGSQLKYATLKAQCLKYCVLAFQQELEAWYKFQSVFLAALILKEKDLPTNPYLTRPGVLVGGQFFRYSRSLLNRRINPSVMQFAASVLQLKRAALPLPDIKIAKSLDQHRELLGTCPEVSNAVNDSIQVMKELNARLFPEATESKPRLPSYSAHYGVSRKDGGASFRIWDEILVPMGLSKLSTTFIGYTKSNPPVPIYLPAYMESIGRLIEERSRRETLDCTVHVVLEPCKARIITAGPAYTYHVCRTIQKAVFRNLRVNPHFQLCGTPLSKEILDNMYTNLPTTLKDGRASYVSADYSAATDRLNGLLSEAYTADVGGRLGLSDQEQRCFDRSMSAHTLHYPDEFGGGSVDQLNGQLMGSPSSFPALCILNAAILVAAYKSYLETDEGSLSTLPSFESSWSVMSYLRPLINGDDLLFRCPSGGFYRYWWNFATECGLAPSAGKNYVSDRFVTLNSEYYLVDNWTSFSTLTWDEKKGRTKYVPPLWQSSFTKVGWLNTGLCRGRSKVLSDTRHGEKSPVTSIDWTSVGAQFHRLIQSMDATGVKRATDLFIIHNKEDLMSTDRSWRLPVVLGGIGLPFGGATRPQLALAHYLVHNRDSTYKVESLRETTAQQEQYDKVCRGVLKKFCREVTRWEDTYRIIDGVIHEFPEVDTSIVPNYMVPLHCDPLKKVAERSRFRNFSSRMSKLLQRTRIGPLKKDYAFGYVEFSAFLGSVVFPTGPETVYESASLLNGLNDLVKSGAEDPPEGVASLPDIGTKVVAAEAVAVSGFPSLDGPQSSEVWGGHSPSVTHTPRATSLVGLTSEIFLNNMSDNIE